VASSPGPQRPQGGDRSVTRRTGLARLAVIEQNALAPAPTSVKPGSGYCNALLASRASAHNGAKRQAYGPEGHRLAYPIVLATDASDDSDRHLNLQFKPHANRRHNAALNHHLTQGRACDREREVHTYLALRSRASKTQTIAVLGSLRRPDAGGRKCFEAVEVSIHVPGATSGPIGLDRFVIRTVGSDEGCQRWAETTAPMTGAWGGRHVLEKADWWPAGKRPFRLAQRISRPGARCNETGLSACVKACHRGSMCGYRGEPPGRTRIRSIFAA